MKRLFGLLLLVTLLALDALPSIAQLPPLDGLEAGAGPLEIESDEGLELYQEQQLAIARGDVLVRQGRMTLRADLVSASYAEVEGRRSIHRVDAVGNVRIDTGKERMFGNHATYDLRRELFIVTGNDLRIEGQDQTVTAEDSLEYWGAEQRAVARGNARAIRNEDQTTLRADVIEAKLGSDRSADARSGRSNAPANAERLSLDTLRAWGGVVITTPGEIVHGARGVYDARNKQAVLDGGVRITRGQNQLNGERAVIDLEHGVSRLVAAPGTRVRSIFYPGSEAEQAPAPQQRRQNLLSVRPRPRPVKAP